MTWWMWVWGYRCFLWTIRHCLSMICMWNFVDDGWICMGSKFLHVLGKITIVWFEIDFSVCFKFFSFKFLDIFESTITNPSVNCRKICVEIKTAPTIWKRIIYFSVYSYFTFTNFYTDFKSRINSYLFNLHFKIKTE